jgi:hypothetical protein
MLEEKKRPGRKVNAWIPDDLYSKVDDLKYKTWTEAIVTGLELLVKSTEKVHDVINEVQECTEKSTLDDFEVQKVQIENDAEIRELRVQVREQREHIETLKAELEKSAQREASDKRTHDNYMSQRLS